MELVRQTSQSNCALNSTYGCIDGTNTMWVQNCRGKFRCGSHANVIDCGVKVTEPGRHNCTCGRPARPVPMYLRQDGIGSNGNRTDGTHLTRHSVFRQNCSVAEDAAFIHFQGVAKDKLVEHRKLQLLLQQREHPRRMLQERAASETAAGVGQFRKNVHPAEWTTSTSRRSG